MFVTMDPCMNCCVYAQALCMILNGLFSPGGTEDCSRECKFEVNVPYPTLFCAYSIYGSLLLFCLAKHAVLMLTSFQMSHTMYYTDTKEIYCNTVFFLKPIWMYFCFQVLVK